MVTWDRDADDVPEGYYGNAVYSLETNTDTDGAWEDANGAQLAGGDTTGLARFNAGDDDDGEFMVRVVATASYTGDDWSW